MSGPVQSSYSGPAAQFPNGPLSNIESCGAAAAHSETAGVIAGGFKSQLADGTLVRGGGSVESHGTESHGIGVNANHSA